MPADHVAGISLLVELLGKIGEVEMKRGFLEASDYIRLGEKGIDQVFLQSAGWPD